MTELKVRLMERMLGAELTEHLGYEPHGEPTSEQTNRRNGATRKVLKDNDGAVPIEPRAIALSSKLRFDCRAMDGSFEPELIQKGQTRIDGMDDKIIHCPGLYLLKIERKKGTSMEVPFSLILPGRLMREPGEQSSQCRRVSYQCLQAHVHSNCSALRASDERRSNFCKTLPG
jgi:hypothetical protein